MVSMDGAPDIGGVEAGVRPMEMLLMGLGGCSGIDIGLILNKQKLYPTDIRFKIQGERHKNQTPSLFETVHLEVFIDGELPAPKVKRAVDLSIQKYCSVAKTLQQANAKITYTTYLNNQEI